MSVLASPLPTSFGAEPRIGLGVTGQNPMKFVAEKGTMEFRGYIIVVNDGTVASRYEVTPEGQIADLEGWNVTVDPRDFHLSPDVTRKVDVIIKCPETEGTYTGGLRISACTENVTVTGKGILEYPVAITVRLTPREIEPPSSFYTQWWFYLGLVAAVTISVGTWFSWRKLRVANLHRERYRIGPRRPTSS
jgi:hypothetical protein